MPALTPRATPVREGDSALVRVLEACIETLKAENEILRRRLAAAETWAAQAVIAAMSSPTMRSGQADCQRKAVTSPAAMIATLASVSLRADRNAARVRLPLWWRWRASVNAQNKLTASAPSSVSVRATGSGGAGMLNFCQAVQRVASPGTSRMPTSAIPTRARLRAVQPGATMIRELIEESSRNQCCRRTARQSRSQLRPRIRSRNRQC